MRRERKPQTQNRMVFRNRDHREIIMEDQYHGAVYIDDEPEPAWRKYKPKLLSMDIGGYNIVYDGSSRSLGGCLISFDVDNKYVSFADHKASTYQATSYKLGNMLYKQEASYGYTSINGYDWKAKQVTFSGLSSNPTIYQYGKYLMAYGSNSYNFYEIDYNEGNAEFSGPTIVKQISSFPFSWQKHLGHVDTDEYQGAFFFYGNTVASFGAGLTSYKNVSVKLSLGLDMEYQDVFTYTGSNYDSCTVSNVFNVNQRYVFFIRYFRFTSWNSQDVSSNIYGRTSILYSDPGDPTSWHEVAVTPERLFIKRVDNLRNRIYDHIQIGRLSGITMIYKNSTYYLYMNTPLARSHPARRNPQRTPPPSRASRSREIHLHYRACKGEETRRRSP